MKIVALADLHGMLPKIPPCDLLLLVGDYCPGKDPLFQASWLRAKFRPWLDKIQADDIVAVWGNHDMVAEKAKEMVPRLRWEVLTDRFVEVQGLKIYGLPWTEEFFQWAFMLTAEQLAEKYKAIPEGMDIVLSHGPPLGYGDLTIAYPHVGLPVRRTGCPEFTKRIEETKIPLVCVGHIHEGRGVYQLGDSVIANVTHVDVNYRAIHKPMVFSWEDGKVEVLI